MVTRSLRVWARKTPFPGCSGCVRGRREGRCRVSKQEVGPGLRPELQGGPAPWDPRARPAELRFRGALLFYWVPGVPGHSSGDHALGSPGVRGEMRPIPTRRPGEHWQVTQHLSRGHLCSVTGLPRSLTQPHGLRSCLQLRPPQTLVSTLCSPSSAVSTRLHRQPRGAGRPASGVCSITCGLRLSSQ